MEALQGHSEVLEQIGHKRVSVYYIPVRPRFESGSGHICSMSFPFLSVSRLSSRFYQMKAKLFFGVLLQFVLSGQS